MSREPTMTEIKSLKEQKEAVITEAICRFMGRTDWQPEELKGRADLVDKKDGYSVFSIDKKDLILISPAIYDWQDDKWIMKIEWLFDKTDYVHHTKEDEKC